MDVALPIDPTDRGERPSPLRRRSHRWLYLCLAAIPCLGPFLLIRFLGAKVLVYDEWGLPYLFQKLRDGDLLLSVVWSGNHEHRLVFPRLFFCLVAVTTRWDPRVVMYASVVAMMIAWIAFIWVLTHVFRFSGIQSILAIGLSSLMFFSLCQEENWLWAFQFAFFLILACQVLALAILMTEKFSLSTRIVSAAALCLIASFSSAQGLFSWIALLPSILAACSRRKFGWLIVGGWVLTAILVWIIYLKGLDLSHSGGLRVLLAQPFPVLRFALVLLANPFIGDVPLQTRFIVACIVGPMILSLMGFALVGLARKMGWAAAAPLLSLVLIGLIPVAALSTGRLNDGTWIFQSSRYTSAGIPATVATVLALCVLQAGASGTSAKAERNSKFSFKPWGPRTTKYIFFSLCILLSLGWLWNLPNSIRQAVSESERRKIADEFNLFSDCLHERIDGSLNPTPESQHFGISLSGLNDKGGMRQLSDGGYRRLVENPVFVSSPGDLVGKIDDPDQLADASHDSQTVDLSGFCKIRSKDQFSPFVLATVPGSSKITGATYVPALKRPHLDEEIRWKLSVSRSLCDADNQGISLDAWVYDRTKKTFCLIGRTTLPASN
jgi:hypothetical protein